MTLGNHGNITADEARRKAKQVLGLIADGIDVAADRRRQKHEVQTAPSVAEMGQRFLDIEAKAKLKPSTLKRYKWLLDKVIVPGLGQRLIRDVVKGDVKKWHAGLSATPTQGNRALALLSTIFNQAIDDGYRPSRDNPTEGVKHYREQARKRYLSEKEIAALGAALREAETIGIPWVVDETKAGAKHLAKAENRRTTIDPFAAAALRLYILTGARLGEILTLQWPFVDLEASVLRLPDSKTGAKVIRLNAPACPVLAALPRLPDQPFVIPGEDIALDGNIVKTHRTDLKRPWNAVRKLAGLEDVHIHDLRHTLAAVAVASNVSLRLIGGLLGHSSEKTSARDAHLSDDPLRDAAEKVGTRIADALDGNTLPAPPNNLSRLPKRR